MRGWFWWLNRMQGTTAARMTEGEVLQALAVPEDAPVLRAVRAVLVDLENAVVEELRGRKGKTEEMWHLAGQLEMAAAAQEQIERWRARAWAMTDKRRKAKG